MNGTPILPWDMIAYIMRFALRIFVNKDLVRELILPKEGTYSRGLGVLDIHVMLPSHIAEKRRLVRQRAMYNDVPYHDELRRYNEEQKKVGNWLKAIDATYTKRSTKKLQQISRVRLLTLWTQNNTTLPYFNGKSYEI
jgi:hypothetical protein